MNFVRINCQEEFLSKLKGVSEPEAKRKIIGTEFYNVFWNKIRENYGSGYFLKALFILTELKAVKVMQQRLKLTTIR